jgi:hypothetical protein
MHSNALTAGHRIRDDLPASALSQLSAPRIATSPCIARRHRSPLCPSPPESLAPPRLCRRHQLPPDPPPPKEPPSQEPPSLLPPAQAPRLDPDHASRATKARWLAAIAAPGRSAAGCPDILEEAALRALLPRNARPAGATKASQDQLAMSKSTGRSMARWHSRGRGGAEPAPDRAMKALDA